jgi:hypothetical protein
MYAWQWQEAYITCMHLLNQGLSTGRYTKLRNIFLLDQLLQPKIADFGSSLIFPDERSTHITTRLLLGEFIMQS